MDIVSREKKRQWPEAANGGGLRKYKVLFKVLRNSQENTCA